MSASSVFKSLNHSQSKFHICHVHKDSPDSHRLILTSRGKNALFVRVPVKAIALGFVANKLDLSVDLSWRGGLKRMLCTIKDQDFSINTKRGDNVWVLGLIACLVDFTRVFDLLDDLKLQSRRIASLAISANLATLLVVVGGVCARRLGYLDISNLEVVRAQVGSVSSKQQTVHLVVFVFGLFDVGEPLNCERRPSQCRSVQVSYCCASQCTSTA